jgi:DNA repair exonuclease SbcCD ATPase subunit
MKKHLILLSIFLLAAVAAFPQGRGGGGNRGQGRQQAQPRTQQRQQQGVQSGQGATERKRIQIHSEQRQQIQECRKTADGIRKQAQKMAQTSGNKFNAEEARQQRNQIQNQLQTMQEEHEQLMQGLDSGQQQALRERIQNMNQLQQQMNTQLRQMNSELAPANPDPAKVSEQARTMEQTMERWRKEYNALSSETE